MNPLNVELTSGGEKEIIGEGDDKHKDFMQGMMSDISRDCQAFDPDHTKNCIATEQKKRKNTIMGRNVNCLEQSDLLLDSASLNLDWSRFCKEFFISLFPYITMIFFPFWVNYSNRFYFEYTNIFTRIDLVMTISITTCTALYFVIFYGYVGHPGEVASNGASIVSELGLNFVVPLMFFTLHRFSIAIKYASFSATEYSRYEHSTVEMARKYQMEQIQLNTAWADKRTLDIIEFEVYSSAAKLNLNLGKVFISIENPLKGNVESNAFKNWQAFLLNRISFKGLTNDAHSDLDSILQKQSDGTYRLGIFSIIKAIYYWTDLEASDPIIPNKEEAKKQNHIKDHMVHVRPYQNFLYVCYAIIFLLPVSFSSIDLKGISTSLKVAVFFQIIFSFITLVMVVPVFGFTMSLMRDTVRRGVEAHLLAEMIRTTDAVENFRYTRISRTSKGINLLFEQSSIDVDGNGNSLSDENGKLLPGVDEEMYYSTRVPKLSSTIGCRSNILAWVNMRALFKTIGQRFKLRMDITLTALFLSVLMLLLIFTALALLTEESDDFNLSYASPAPRQIVVIFCLSVLLLLGNISEGAITNEQFSMHGRLIQQRISSIEARFSQLADKFGYENPDDKDKAEMNVLRDVQLSYITAFSSTVDQDSNAALKVLGVPATQNFYTGMMSLLASSFVGFVTALLRQDTYVN